ncbi:unnamed protein product [Discula destructiva]
MATPPSTRHGARPSPHSSPTSPPSKPKPTLRILCFGDSLTSGYSSQPDHPYEHAVTKTLTRAFPSLTIDAHVSGIPGDTVSLPGSRFLSRIEPTFLTKGGGTPFDWTVILGGTNDLALGVEPKTIFEALRAVWAVPLSKGGRVLACTVPDSRAGKGGVAARRDQVNGLIRAWRQENFHVFDLAAAIPYANMEPAERAKYWDDHVHLTPAGYDLMGEKIAARLVELIMPPGRLQKTKGGERAPKKRRVFQDDEKSFEEEIGDDSLLGQGYVVVRRKDLE